jgi:acetyl esterase/lipase
MVEDGSVEDRSVLEREAPAPDGTWSYGERPDEIADLYHPPPGAAARVPVLLVHGGYWRPEFDRMHLRPMAAALAAAGHSTVLVEYPRRPGRPDATVDAVRAALAGVADVVDAPVIVVGHSAGGHLALLAAQPAGTAAVGVLALAPVADLAMADRLGLDDGAVRAFLGRPAVDCPDLDPAALPRPTVPVTVVHGAADTLVPLVLAQSYCDGGPARLVVLDGIGHFEPIDPVSAAWPVVIAELSALGPASGIE